MIRTSNKLKLLTFRTNCMYPLCKLKTADAINTKTVTISKKYCYTVTSLVK